MARETPSDASEEISRTDLSRATIFDMCTLLVVEKLGPDSRGRGCVILSPLCYTICRPPVSCHTSSASNGQPPHAAASTAEAVAGPTPFSSAVRAVTAFFNGPRDIRATATSSPPSNGGVDGEEFPGRKRNASRLLAFTCEVGSSVRGCGPKLGFPKEGALIGMSKAVEIFLVSFAIPSLFYHPFISVFPYLLRGVDTAAHACDGREEGRAERGAVRDSAYRTLACSVGMDSPNYSIYR